LDQLERRYCKDTPFFRPFYIGAPKGPFLPGLKLIFFTPKTDWRESGGARVANHLFSGDRIQHDEVFKLFVLQIRG
jgi:hypothetical protein